MTSAFRIAHRIAPGRRCLKRYSTHSQAWQQNGSIGKFIAVGTLTFCAGAVAHASLPSNFSTGSSVSMALDSGSGSSELGTAAGPSEEEVTSILTKGAELCTGRRDGGDGFTQYHTALVPSNGPAEDRQIHGYIKLKNQRAWYAWAIFDGHAGSQTAELLTKQLVPFVRKGLDELSSEATEDGVHSKIRDSFLALDKAIIQRAVSALHGNEPYQDKLTALAQAYAGSCALLSLFDPETRTLRVANVGDSRAVLGCQRRDGSWEAVPLSVDQTGSNEDEAARINAEHPGESGIVKDGRVLGIMVSRGFGDGRWKWNLEFQQYLKENFDGFNPLPSEKYAVRTPPYLTAEPVITSTKIASDRPSFLIMASDGFWDHVSNQQAISLVSGWLLWKDGKIDSPAVPKYEPLNSLDLKEHGSEFRFKEERRTYRDDNAAVHLVRNAFGGNRHEVVSGTLALGTPFSRYARDDITVQVIFFNHQT